MIKPPVSGVMGTGLNSPHNRLTSKTIHDSKHNAMSH